MAVELTKKENLLFNLLKEELDKICEREKIIETVWPESEELGVSDWTIDRLVARLREKLKRQKSKFSVVTVKTRGYKLVKSDDL
ncbi:helix-turn-helix domain-containing protein [Candidatus Curtissbacteria bacterium]|nr:helix-turn-helix domain-containing protein [Candidatus Curtissbacteria bacterium]